MIRLDDMLAHKKLEQIVAYQRAKNPRMRAFKGLVVADLIHKEHAAIFGSDVNNKFTGESK